jgi:hypothetical protein
VSTQDQQAPQGQSEWAAWNDLPLEAQQASLPRQLAGQHLQIELPRRLIDRSDVLSACQGQLNPQTYTRIVCAALLLCWPAAQRKSGAPRYKGELLEYGGEVYEFLLGHGATEAEILRAGTVAMRLCNQAAVTQLLAQEEARGNSQTPGDGLGSSSSSPSRSGSALSQVALLTSNPSSQDS